MFGAGDLSVSEVVDARKADSRGRSIWPDYCSGGGCEERSCSSIVQSLHNSATTAELRPVLVIDA